MAADFVQAGSFVAAVLEQAGYLAQERFLDEFTRNGFFSEAGAFIYVLGGIGGIISMIVFGSFRAARYLLIGPALFWFLLQPRVDYDGAIWKIGVGAARGMNLTEGVQQARNYRDWTIQNSGTGRTGGPIRVAAGFALFARPINNLVSDFIGLILNNDTDRYYKMVWSKGRAFEVLLSVRVEDARYYEMLESDFVRQCSDMFEFGLARAAFDLRSEVRAQASYPQDPERRARFYEEYFREISTRRYVNPGEKTRGFLRAAGSQQQDVKITCLEMWQIVGAYLEDVAIGQARKVLEIARGDNADPALACKEIMKKIVEGDPGNDCQLARAVALFLLKNSFTDKTSTGRFINRIVNSMQRPRGVEQGALLALASNPTLSGRDQDAAEALVQQFETGAVSRSGMDPRQQVLYILGVGKRWENSERDAAARQKIRDTTRTAAVLTAIGGPLDAGLTEFPRYHLKSLRQQIFTFTMHLPYWQGVLLYLLACAYPFCCLIVLLPGRAAGFLNFPLAWLWVKSWDIGIACVMVLERVLWNVLPSLKIPRTVAEQDLQRQDLWNVLSEAQKFDHTWNLHIYYTVLAMVTFAIPGVTGYATLRSRRAILSSFTSKLMEDAKDAGQRASGMHGMRVMAERVRTMDELRGAADRLVRQPGEGMRAAGREQSALAYARLAGQMKLAQVAPKILADALNNPIRADERLMSAIKGNAQAKAAFVRTYSDVLTKEAQADAAYLAAFDPLIGRYGKLGIMNEAYAAAMDGYGGYELNAHTINATPELIDLHKYKTNLQFEAMATVGLLQKIVHDGSKVADPVLGDATALLAKAGMDITALKANSDGSVYSFVTGRKLDDPAQPSMYASRGDWANPAAMTEKLKETFKALGVDTSGFADEQWRSRVLGITPEAAASYQHFLQLGAVRGPDGRQLNLQGGIATGNEPVQFDLDLAARRFRIYHDIDFSQLGDPRFILEDWRKRQMRDIPLAGDAIQLKPGGEGLLNNSEWLENLRDPSKAPKVPAAGPPAVGEPPAAAPGGGATSMRGMLMGPLDMEEVQQSYAALNPAKPAAGAQFVGAFGATREALEMHNKVAGMKPEGDPAFNDREYKERMAALNMEWLFGDDEDAEQRERGARKFITSKPRSGKTVV